MEKKPIKTKKIKRESPDDFWVVYLNWLKSTGLENAFYKPTYKTFRLLRGKEKENAKG